MPWVSSEFDIKPGNCSNNAISRKVDILPYFHTKEELNAYHKERALVRNRRIAIAHAEHQLIIDMGELYYDDMPALIVIADDTTTSKQWQ